MTTTQRIIKSRLDAQDHITLYSGGHNAPPANASPTDIELCINEYVAWITGEPHSAAPRCQCPVIGAALMRFNDRTDNETRQALKGLGVRSVGTRGDGFQHQRAYLATDAAVRVFLPIWLDAAGRSEAAALVRAHEEIVDEATAYSARMLVREVRGELPDYWQWRQELRTKVKQIVLEALKKRPDVDAVAGGVAVAWGTYYEEVYEAVKAKLVETLGSKWGEAQLACDREFLALLDRMLSLGEADRVVIINGNGGVEAR